MKKELDLKCPMNKREAETFKPSRRPASVGLEFCSSFQWRSCAPDHLSSPSCASGPETDQAVSRDQSSVKNRAESEAEDGHDCQLTSQHISTLQGFSTEITCTVHTVPSTLTIINSLLMTTAI